jgi:YrbI family 3-deoxy-D-manno-octulosonate 8-phosphate phosphatase
MVDRPEVLAIIPARGGSKGIPRKNIRCFASHPLIAWSIAAARQSSLVTRVIISTDDEEIAEIGRQHGAEAPFLRPAELSNDLAVDLPLFEHALAWLAENEGYRPDYVVQLRPTSPIRPRGLVDGALQLLIDHPDADSVRGVVPSGQNPYKMWRIEGDRMVPLLHVEGVAEPYNSPRQELPPTYWQTGHIDAIRTSTILNKHSLSGDVILPYQIDPTFTVDIDSLRDWTRAEWLVWNSKMDMVYPGKPPRPFPEKVSLIVMDFDGVLTDNRVWVDDTGREAVAAFRSDSLGLALLRGRSGIEPLVISMETNPVVTARCRKMNVPVLQGITHKAEALLKLLAEKNIDPAEVVYLGNDVNDLECFPVAGYAVAPSDAEPEVQMAADMVLTRKGGHGAVREMCDLLMEKIVKSKC